MMSFGKYKGEPVATVREDRDYSGWLLRQPWFQAPKWASLYKYLDGTLEDYIEEHIVKVAKTPKASKASSPKNRKGTEVRVGDQVFPTQVEAKAYVRGILQRITYSQSVKTEYPDEYMILLSLCQQHPDAADKLDSMVDLQVERNALNPKGFALYVLKEGGHRVDISWTQCITQERPSEKQNRRRGMRYAVDEQIEQFKRCRDSSVCGICEKTIVGEKHVDHIVPFDTLAAEFEKGWTSSLPTRVEDVDDGTNRHRFMSEDREFETAWADFHREKATLRIACALCNLKRKKCT